ncbi:LNS2 (Lipin/Ned1/Smp2) protein [Toxoplasma gondii p89]|uniref:phosphatidate phosphatase n=1 Tax=Toxoplasma gondii p89 TaxID=943119 RepID=A0A086L2L0_TOXGO|nr:LNS2 (Lipin/Ned1/Smp2) protein [Toxoplasma gondii p89]
MWGKIVSSVSNALDFNQATLSGCIDIICVRSTDDNKLRSTPFHVRFGKAKLLRSREKTVTVTVNGVLTSLRMKLGAAGEAYFVHEDEGAALGDLGDEESASPILSPRSNASGEGGGRTGLEGFASRDEEEWRRRDEDEKDRAEDGSQAGDGDEKEGAGAGNEAGAGERASTDSRLVAGDALREVPSVAGDVTRSPVASGEEPEGAPATLSRSASQAAADAEQERERMVVGGVGAPAVAPSALIDRGFPEDQQLGAGPVTDSRVAAESQAGSASGVSFSLCGHMLTGRVSEEQHDNDVFNANVVSWEAFDHNPALWYHPSLVARFDDKPPYYPGKVALPLLACWLVFNRPLSVESLSRLMNAEVTANLEPPNFSSALSSASRWFFGSRASASAPASKSPTRFPYPKAATEGKDERGGSTGADAPGPKAPVVVTSKNSVAQATASAAASVATIEEASGVRRDEEGEWKEGSALVNSASFHSELGTTVPSASCTACSARRFRRSLRPTSDQLASLNLKPGANSICFTVSSSLQGTKSVMGTIYLWPQYPKIVISDVDGTITRSDVLGQLMPIVGRDWSHDGVAELFTKIKKAGYLILYLTARAIGQADATRDYLFGLTQQQTNKLPDGPLILSPDRLFPSFKREVIERKPYIFKIAALRDIRSLFPPDYNPFYAGFGNRDSDHRAYVHVGVAEAKVFIIDPSGAIHHINNSTYARTYETMSEIADFMFPPLPRPDGRLPSEALIKQEEAEEEQFNSFNFWSLGIVDFPSEEDEDESVAGEAVPPSSEPTTIFKDLHHPTPLAELSVSPSAASSAEAASVAAAYAASAAVVALDAAASGRQSVTDERGGMGEDGEVDEAATTRGANEAIETAKQVSIAAALAAAVVKREDEHVVASEEDSAGYETPPLLVPRAEKAGQQGGAQLVDAARTYLMESGNDGAQEKDRVGASIPSEGGEALQIREPDLSTPVSERTPKNFSREADSDSLSRLSGLRTVTGMCDLCGRQFESRGCRRQISLTGRGSSQGGLADSERRCQSETMWTKVDEDEGGQEQLCEACGSRWQSEHTGRTSVEETYHTAQTPQERSQQTAGVGESQVTERGRMSADSVPQIEGEGEEHESEADDKESKVQRRPEGWKTAKGSLSAGEGDVECDGALLSFSVPRSEEDREAAPESGHASQRVWTYVSLDSDGDARDFSAQSRAPEELCPSATGDKVVSADYRAPGTPDENERAEALLTAAAFAADAVTSGNIFLHASNGIKRQVEKNGESKVVTDASANTSDAPREVELADKSDASVNRESHDSVNASERRDLFSRLWRRDCESRANTPCSSSQRVRRSASSFFLPWSPSGTASTPVARPVETGDAVGPQSASFVCSLPVLRSASSYDAAASSISFTYDEKTPCLRLESSGSETSLARRADTEPEMQIVSSEGVWEGGDSEGAHENKNRDAEHLSGLFMSSFKCGSTPIDRLPHEEVVALNDNEAGSCVVGDPHGGSRPEEGARSSVSRSDRDVSNKAAICDRDEGNVVKGGGQVLSGTPVTPSRSSSKSKRELRMQESFRSVGEGRSDDGVDSERKCSNL